MKYQFNQAVRIAPLVKDQKSAVPTSRPRVFSAGVQDIDDESITGHPHFQKFVKAGLIVEYIPKSVPTATPAKIKTPRPHIGTLFGPGGSLKDAQDPKVAANKDKAVARTKTAADEKAKASKATDVSPETTIGEDAPDPDAKPKKSKK